MTPAVTPADGVYQREVLDVAKAILSGPLGASALIKTATSDEKLADIVVTNAQAIVEKVMLLRAPEA